MAQLTRQEIATFYDTYSKQQKSIGVNIRHRTIIKRLMKAGMKSNAKVLEIGCGIGTLTSLLVKKTQHVLAVDISPESIEIAKNNLAKAQNLTLLVSDMSDFKADQLFDFIILPDVLEHIPIEQHDRLFYHIKKHLHPNGKVCIHIPDPYALEWMRNTKPELLQIIDQSLYTDILLPAFYNNQLIVEKLERYALQNSKPDYQWIELIHRPTYVDFEKKSYTSAVVDELKSRL